MLYYVCVIRLCSNNYTGVPISFRRLVLSKELHMLVHFLSNMFVMSGSYIITHLEQSSLTSLLNSSSMVWY